MKKSPEWEESIKVWLDFTKVSTDYIKSFKQWLKAIVSSKKPKNSGGMFPG